MSKPQLFAAALFLLTLLFVARATLAQTGGPYSLTWSTVEGGGGTSSGGTYTVLGTIGQPEAGQVNGGNYTLLGGFWQTNAVTTSCPTPLTGVTINGPTSGTTGRSYTFTATINPGQASLPLTYNWAPEPNTGQGTSQARYTWNNPVTQTLTLNVSNCGGSASDEHTIVITTLTVPSPNVFLPLVIK